MKIKKVFLTGISKNTLAKKIALKAKKLFKENNIQVELDKDFFGEGKAISKITCDLVISFGGDGTLLQTARETQKQIPIMGINCGNVGFLQAYQYTEIEKAITSIINGKIRVEKRTRIQPIVDGKKSSLALNEVLIVPTKAGRIMHYFLEIGGHGRKEAGDGLIVATPTGSTAHALSAGGPIVQGNADVFVVVSSNPIDWEHRPVIINDCKKVKVNDFGKTKTEIIIDGQKTVTVKNKVELEKGTDILLVVN